MHFLPRSLIVQIAAFLLLVSLDITVAAASEQIIYTKNAEPDPACDFTPHPCHDIWMANPDGSEAHLVVEGVREGPDVDAGPALSSDGELIATAVYERPNLRDYLFVYGTDGELRFIHNNLHAGTGGKYINTPRFSPDGSKLIYAGDAASGGLNDIYSLSAASSISNALITWANDQQDPTYSPDGSKIAFTSVTNPKGEFNEKWKVGQPMPYHVYVANADGTSPVRVTSSDFEWTASPQFSRDGQRLVFSGNRTKGTPKGPGLFTVKVNGTELMRLTSGSDRSPAWSSDGSLIAFKRSLDGIYTINPNGTGLTEVISDSDADLPAFRQTRSFVDVVGLLPTYAPQIRYEAQEVFYADSAAIITDNPGNYLKREGGSVLAARSVSPYAELSLSFLGASSYANSAPVLTSDFLDEDNADIVSDAQELHLNPAYADRVYGRAVLGSDQHWWLQYWLFYYYNDQDVVAIGLHEGDWEMVQYRLDANGAIDGAAYAQHNGGARCPEEWIERSWVAEGSGGRYAPVVYSARSSHASYFQAGVYRDGTEPEEVVLPDDYATGDGVIANPLFVPISIEDPWVLWPGRWGASDASPNGPLHNEGGGKWSDPSAWADALSVCPPPGSELDSPAAASVPSPEIQVSQARDEAVVDFRFPAWPEDPKNRPRSIIVTVDSAGRTTAGIPYTPLSYTYRVRGQRGSVRQSLGRGSGPYKVLVSASSKDGARSDLVTSALP